MPEWIAGATGAVAVVAITLCLWQRRTVSRLEKQVQQLSSGADERSVVGALHAHSEILKKHEGRIREALSAYQYLHEALQGAIRKVAFERYNPFHGVGGNQSFTFVLLDAHNSGVVISSLHNRDTTRVYAKAVREAKPLQQLSTEEERVLANAVAQPGA